MFKRIIEYRSDDATLARWQDAAREKCPFAYTISHPIPLTTTIERA